jgi:NADH-quinone oxidoreductase subunit L
MVCLLSPMFEYAPAAKHIVVFIGAITALFAATVGMVQNDIKRVIAYSTCSQLGYMFMAAGVGAYQASMFHLFTHAFFKALLFLGAGSVIMGMHHEQDMRNMGGLWKKMPLTYAAMLIGTLAITGIGIPHIELGFAGFYSKDSIINAAFAASKNNPLAGFAFFVGLFAAGLTSFYSWRLIFMTFHGTPKWAHAGHGHGHDDHAHDAHGHDDHASHAQMETHSEPDAHGHDDHGHAHVPHESPLVILVPLALLSFGAVFAGMIFAEKFIGAERVEFWRNAIFTLPTNKVLDGEGPEWELWAPLAITAIGFLAAVWFYLINEGMGARIAAKKGPLWSFLYNKWYFDELYDFVFVRGAKALGDIFWKVGDQKIIDKFGPDGVAAVSDAVGKTAGRIQSGYVYHYAFVMLLGVAGLLSFALFMWRG